MCTLKNEIKKKQSKQLTMSNVYMNYVMRDLAFTAALSQFAQWYS